MRKATAVLQVELTKPLPEQDDLHAFGDAQVLLRLHGAPIGFANVPIEHGRLSTSVLVRQLLDVHAWMFAAPLARRALERRRPPFGVDVRALLTEVASRPFDGPLVTVAVCTRDRTSDLPRCLDALLALEYPHLDLLVVDNAPSTDATERLLCERYPSVRYAREPRPGLDWARNRAIMECRGDILAYTDDDVVVDRGWVSALVRVFAADPQVMAVTGLVIPDQLETDAQRLFETYGGFGRGFIRRWYRAPSGRPLASLHGGTGKFGTGANMAYRRCVFDEIGGFDPALDVGTCTSGGGDLEMFFRVVKHGHTLVYEPSAIVRHRHRATYAQLRTQIANNGIGFYSYLVRSAIAWPGERLAFARLGVWWLRWWNLRRLGRSLLRKERVPRDLIVEELIGSLRGVFRYRAAKRRAADIARDFGGADLSPGSPTRLPARWGGDPPGEPKGFAPARSPRRVPEAVRHIDIAEPLAPIADAAPYERLRLYILWHDVAIGTVRIDHHGGVVSPMWLADAITQQLAAEVLDARTRLGNGVFWSRLTAALADHFAPAGLPDEEGSAPARADLPPHVGVSVVVATRDRPRDLARCLDSLVAQRTSRHVEIIVVDNNPGSGITPAVVANYPSVRLVEERRAGLSFARNAGILAASGDVIACTDDDAVCQPDWLERLVAPFRRGDVMVVTGNVLPMELETEAQRLFEAYGGLGRGFTRLVVDGDWFRRWRRSVPTWELGCTANAAFRATIFSHPQIGLMDEALGAGTPTGCSEDTYVFYRVLRAGYAVAYEPDAVVWHRHRDTMRALRRQIYSYSKGHVAYQLTTWLRDGDRRALVRFLYELPRIYGRRAYERLRGRSDYPMTFIALEVLGCLAGPYALWQSSRRARRLGRTMLREAENRKPDIGSVEEPACSTPGR